MTEILSQYHIGGLIIGICTFLIIGVFHPLVIKGEYHFGVKCWKWFLLAGLAAMAGCLLVDDLFWSSLFGVTAFSCFWSIGEVRQQEKRVRKGWFPRNPRRKYPWDDNADGAGPK